MTSVQGKGKDVPVHNMKKNGKWRYRSTHS